MVFSMLTPFVPLSNGFIRDTQNSHCSRGGIKKRGVKPLLDAPEILKKKDDGLKPLSDTTLYEGSSRREGR
jgi:hypothetical protein